MPRYIHELRDWPNFRWDSRRVQAPLASVRHHQGRLVGRMEGLGFQLQEQASFQALAQEVLKTSEIEGEMLNPTQVRSSLARRLGVDIGALKPADRNVDGVVEMLLDATQNYDQPLTAKRIFGWHAALFPSGWSGVHKIKADAWRKTAVDVISGRGKNERIHFQGPDAARVPAEMREFLNWFEDNMEIDLVLKAAIAHLWFVTVHPFGDGNGRIARTIANMALARSENTPLRFYSMSAQIREEHSSYYDILESTQKGTMDVTPWIEWFLSCLGNAIEGSESLLGSVIKKGKFFDATADSPLNERQRIVLNRLLDGFEGKLTSSKWAKLTKCSQDTAHRDIIDMVNRGILVKDAAGGRSTSYSLKA
ncbi:MAG TPA: Fic family protein [Candidatus Obscuribacterales bacterium]